MEEILSAVSGINKRYESLGQDEDNQKEEKGYMHSA